MKNIFLFLFLTFSALTLSAMEAENTNITILTKDDCIFEISREVAFQSETIKNYFNGESDSELKLDGIDAETFSIIKKLLEAQFKNQAINHKLIQEIFICENIVDKIIEIKNVILALQYLDCTKIIESLIAILNEKINLLSESERASIILKFAENNLMEQQYIDKLSNSRSTGLKRKREQEENSNTVNKKRKTFDAKEIDQQLKNFKNQKHADKIKNLREKFYNIKSEIGFVCPQLSLLALKCIVDNLDQDPDEFLSKFFSSLPGDERDILKKIKRLINAPVNSDENASTRLHLARSPNQVTNLLILGADPHKRDLNGKNSFIRMVERNDVAAAKTLFESVDLKYELLNSADNSGNCATHCIAMRRMIRSSHLILPYINTCDIRLKNNNNETPLMLAVKYGNTIIVASCLSRINNSNIKDLLSLAIENNQTKIFMQIVKNRIISIYGTDIAANNNELDALYSNLFIKAAKFGRNKIFKYLLLHVSNVNCVDSEHRTALQKASLFQHKEIVQLLLANSGLQINQHIQGNKALMAAIRLKNLEIAQLLLTYPTIEVNAQDSNGINVLMSAILNGFKDIAQQLLNIANIQINLQNSDQETALTLAAKMNQIEVVETLLNRKDIEIKLNDQGNKALHYAVLNGNQKMVELLLNQLLIDVNYQDRLGITALHLAAGKGHKDIVNLLIKQFGININAQDRSANSALHEAIWRNQFEIVEILLKRVDVDINMQTANGATPLMIAVFNKNKQIIQLLLKRNDIRLDLLDKQENSALTFAKHNEEIIQMLQNKINEQKAHQNK